MDGQEIFFILCGGILVLYLIREILCKYWKITDIVFNQEDQKKLMQEILKELREIKAQNKKEEIEAKEESTP